ncbi:MAG: iron export ABC transporter permease subunit FetB [Leptospiraceae bacterium]|nr:iron export ABC transporter permease subunit FetB [Leptospiraceae bacterium]MCP5497692.1 iron export ABC transporter permease subunit FetB [Leptospiraceae bacterium]
MTPENISSLSLSYLVGIMILNAGISFALKFNLHQSILVAGFRAILQLILIGYCLRWIFDLKNSLAVFSLVLVMTLIASTTSLKKISYHYPGIRIFNFLALCSSVWPMGLLALWMVNAKPFFSPQYVIPFFGMILGNSLNGISLSVDRFHGELKNRYFYILSQLALGSTPWEACQIPIRESLKAGMTSVLNTMSIVGVVSLPGMMTGQILAGSDPVISAKYQILILFLICTSVFWGCLFGILFSFYKIFPKDNSFSLNWVTH